MSRQSKDRSELAFTLVEMLVVLGIIVLLAGILIPVLSSARRASTNTKCLNNLREIGMAMSQYMSDNEQTIPFAGSTNNWDDPWSPRGNWERTDPRRVPGFILPVAYYLDPYLKYDVRPWFCPAARVLLHEPERQLRPAQIVRSDLSHSKGAEARMWVSGPGFWRPGYMFLSTHGWRWYFKYGVEDWHRYGMIEWKVRNVAGLRLTELTTIGRQSADAIVLFYDYSSTFHSKSGDDVYSLVQNGGNVTGFSAPVQRGKFRSNFLFLDGHVDTRQYEWQGGLLNHIHRPIPQRWDIEPGEGDYTVVYAASYKAPRYPD